MAAKDRITALVQAVADISTSDTAHVSGLIDRAMQYAVAYCHLGSFPDSLQGYSVGAATPTTDISGLGDNEFYIAVNGSPFVICELTLASCTTGALTAAEMQTQIRALYDSGTTLYEEFVEVTATYATTGFVVTSGRFGPDSVIRLSHDAAAPEVARALKLGTAYGGYARHGSTTNMALEHVVSTIVADVYRAGKLVPDFGGTTAESDQRDVGFRVSPDNRAALRSFRRLIQGAL